MKTKTFKSIMAIAACVVFVLIAGFVLTACGGTKEDVYASGAVDFNGATYENASDFKLVKNDETGIYEAEGTLQEMNEDQIRAWFGLAEDADTSTYEAYFACVTVRMEENSTGRRGWIATDATETMLTQENSVRYKERVETGDLDLVLGFIPQDNAYDLSATPIFRVEVTAPVAEGEEAGEPAIYMIDFSNIIANAE